MIDLLNSDCAPYPTDGILRTIKHEQHSQVRTDVAFPLLDWLKSAGFSGGAHVEVALALGFGGRHVLVSGYG